jgi:hypothetical protein
MDELYAIPPAGHENACFSFTVHGFILQDFLRIEQRFVGFKVRTAVTIKSNILPGRDAV